MTDSNQAEGEKIAEEATPQEAAPTSEQQPTESQEPQAPVEEGADVDEKVALENSKNPERTAAYIEKLKAERDAALKASSNYGTSVFDQFRPQVQATPNLNQQQVENIATDFVDQDGNVDINGLNRALKDANDRALRAEQSARMSAEQIARFEENQQAREAHAKFPELDPLRRDSFDPQFYDLVRNKVLANMYEGKEKSLVEVAEEIKSVYKSAPVNQEVVAKQAVETFKKSQTAKAQQQPLETGKGETQSSSNLQDLRERTRRGDGDAIAERLKNLGI